MLAAINWDVVIPLISVPVIGVVLAVLNNHNASVLSVSIATAASAQREQEASIRKEEREADWARQDRVADRLSTKQDEIAQEAKRQQDEVRDQAAAAAALLIASNAQVADSLTDSRAETNGKLDVIHTLVNSNMTAAMQGELDSAKRELVSLLEIVDLKAALRTTPPTQDALDQITITRERIEKLETDLQDRKLAASLAADQIETAKLKAEN